MNATFDNLNVKAGFSARIGSASVQRLIRARVVTEYLNPPIPTTAFDWIAYREGQEDGHRGFGRTEAESITELLESEE